MQGGLYELRALGGYVGVSLLVRCWTCLSYGRGVSDAGVWFVYGVISKFGTCVIDWYERIKRDYVTFIILLQLEMMKL